MPTNTRSNNFSDVFEIEDRVSAAFAAAIAPNDLTMFNHNKCC